MNDLMMNFQNDKGNPQSYENDNCISYMEMKGVKSIAIVVLFPSTATNPASVVVGIVVDQRDHIKDLDEDINKCFERVDFLVDQVSIKLKRVGYLRAQVTTSIESFEAIEDGIQKSEERRKSLNELEKEVKAGMVEYVLAKARTMIEVEAKREIPENKDGIQKSEERRKSLNEIEKEVKASMVEYVLPEMRRTVEVEVQREIQENNDLKDFMKRVCLLEQIVKGKYSVQSGIQDAQSPGDGGMDLNEMVTTNQKSIIDEIASDMQNLRRKSMDLEAKVKKLEDKEKVMKTLDSLKEEIGVRERLSKVVNRFENRLPVMVGVLGVLFTITFPCKIRKVLSWLIGFSCTGLLVMAGLAAFHFWETSKDIGVLTTAYEKLNSDYTKKRDEANEDVDIEKGERFEFGTFWSYAWPHMVDTFVLLVLALAFVVSVGIFISSEKCIKADLPDLGYELV